MAALTDHFHGWRPNRGSPNFFIKKPVAGADEFFRGAICTTAVVSAKIKVTNGITTDKSVGIVGEALVATAADQLVQVMTRGIAWFTGVAAIAHGTDQDLLYPLLTSDNPADLTATAAGNCAALGRVIGVEVTAVSGYVDISDRALVSDVT